MWGKYILTSLFIVIGFVGAFATHQIPDKLICNGDTLSVSLDLPDEFYTPDTVIFDSFEYINHILTVNLFGDKKTCISTACGRGYQAKWEVVGNQLYLTGIYSCCYYEDSIKADLSSLFKAEKIINGKVKADWVSSKYTAQGGERLFLSYDISVFKKEFEFEFLEGKLVNIKIFDNSKSKKSIYSHDDVKLLNFIYTNIDWNILPAFEPVRVTLRFSANEDGKIDEVEFIRKSDDEILNQEALRVIKSIPEWDVIYLQGRHSRQYFTIPILFKEENREKYGR